MSKQKTPLAELIELFEKSLWISVPDIQWPLYINKKKELLAKEREVIINSFVAGDERGTRDIPFNAEQYFNQTFEQ